MGGCAAVLCIARHPKVLALSRHKHLCGTRELRQHGLEASISAGSNVIMALCRANKPLQALSVFDDMLHHGPGPAQAPEVRTEHLPVHGLMKSMHADIGCCHRRSSKLGNTRWLPRRATTAVTALLMKRVRRWRACRT